MTDKLDITIRVAGQKPMSLRIDRDYEPVVRNAEFQVNRLYGRWSDKYHDKSHIEVLSMVAFRFAELFCAQTVAAESAEKLLDDFEGELDKLLLEAGQ